MSLFGRWCSKESLTRKLDHRQRGSLTLLIKKWPNMDKMWAQEDNPLSGDEDGKSTPLSPPFHFSSMSLGNVNSLVFL